MPGKTHKLGRTVAIRPFWPIATSWDENGLSHSSYHSTINGPNKPKEGRPGRPEGSCGVLLGAVALIYFAGESSS